MMPTARTLAYLRKAGVVAGVVERRVPNKPNITIDLFGFIDVVALDGGIVGVQCTTVDHMANRARKIRAEPRAVEWMQDGGQIWVVGWAKYGPKNGKKLWKSRWLFARLEDGKIEFSEGHIRD